MTGDPVRRVRGRNFGGRGRTSRNTGLTEDGEGSRLRLRSEGCWWDCRMGERAARREGGRVFRGVRSSCLGNAGSRRSAGDRIVIWLRQCLGEEVRSADMLREGDRCCSV